MLAIHHNVATIFQFYAWQLLDERVEHGAFGQLESISIVNECVAVDIELHLRGLHHYFVQGHTTLLLHIERFFN